MTETLDAGAADSTDRVRPRSPRFNHVAMSLPPDALDEQGRADIVRFYETVFGWEELPTMTQDRKRLVLHCHTVEQFVFLIAEDEPMRCPRLDHFGLSVASLDELEACFERAKGYAVTDDRVDLIERDIDDYEVLKIHNFYVGYLLPMMVEIQYWEYPN